jgi:outer membrane autotransporter protein
MLVVPALSGTPAGKALAQTVSPEDVKCPVTGAGNFVCRAEETDGPPLEVIFDDANVEFDAEGAPADFLFAIDVDGGTRGINFTLGSESYVAARDLGIEIDPSLGGAAIGLILDQSDVVADINATIGGAVIEEQAAVVDAHTDGIYVFNRSLGAVSVLVTGSVTSRGNAIAALSRGDINIINRGTLTNTGEQDRGDRGNDGVEGAGLLVWATGNNEPFPANGEQVITIDTSGTIIGGNTGIRVVHSGSGEINIDVAGLVAGHSGVAILPTSSFDPLTSVSPVNADLTVTLQPGWETDGETYGFTTETASLVFGGTAEQTAQSGLGQFDLADWDDRTLESVGNEPDQSTNGFFYFEPVLLKTGTSTFEITGDRPVSENDADGLAGPEFIEAVVEDGILVLNNATITMAFSGVDGDFSQDGPELPNGNDFVVPETPGLENEGPNNRESRGTFEVQRSPRGATLGVVGRSQITGNLNNSGTLDLSTFDRTAETQLTITEDYTANSNLVLDVELGGDGSPSDVLVIEGNTFNDTHVTVNNAGGTGAQTVTGIPVVKVAGASDGEFLLANGDYTLPDTNEAAIIAGAYGYALRPGADGDWYLQSHLSDMTPIWQPGSPVYEALPSTLLNASRVGTLAQRIEGRQLLTQSASTDTPTGAWVRVEGSRMELTPARSSTSTSYDQNMWHLQGGVDVLAYDGELGNLVIGANVFTGGSSADIASSSGNGSISTDTQGMGLTATWYGNSGFYADIQLQYSDFESDLSSNVLGTLATGLDGYGRLASLEIGQEFTLSNGLSLTPQAQLTWSEVSFDSFTGPSGEIVSPGSNDSLRLRLGLAAERSWDFGSGESARLYGIGNVVRELRDTSSVMVSGTELALSAPRWVGEIGLGGSYDWTQDTGATSSFYGEVSASRELSGGTVHGLAGTIGFRMEF